LTFIPNTEAPAAALTITSTSHRSFILLDHLFSKWSEPFPFVLLSPIYMKSAPTGAVTTNRDFYFRKFTHNYTGSSTITNGATVTIEGAPSGTNATYTNAAALWIEAGNIRLGTSATAGHVLTADANGNLTLQASGGITNGAAANELGKSDGTNITTSGIFVTTLGSPTFGTGLSGGTRTFTADGSASDVGFTFVTKGSGSIINSTTPTTGGSGDISLADYSTTNSVEYPSTIQRTSSGTPATGIGSGLKFVAEVSPGLFPAVGTIDLVMTDVTSSSEDSDLSVNLKAAGGALAERFRVKSTGVLRLPVSYTVSTLPSGQLGDFTYVTDATAPTFLGTLTGGGSVTTPVFYNGTAWVSY